MSAADSGENEAQRIHDFEKRVRADGRYPPEAFEFLHRGLAAASQHKYGTPEEQAAAGARHVSGQELCLALRALALEQWGPLAPAVLKTWNIHRTRDFGELVYLMISWGLMGKQDSDNIEDFDDVYDFHTAFSDYEIPLDPDADE
jgi:uncharacterized repeat protein (TIGR04138 family)